jgi:hypothetical protein
MSHEAILFKVKMNKKTADCVLHVRDGRMFLWLGYMEHMHQHDLAVTLLKLWFTGPVGIVGGWAPYRVSKKTRERILQILTAEEL